MNCGLYLEGYGASFEFVVAFHGSGLGDFAGVLMSLPAETSQPKSKEKELTALGCETP